MSGHEGNWLLWCHKTVECVLVSDHDVIQVELRNAAGRTFLRKLAPNHQDAFNEAEYLRLLFRAGGHRVRPGGLKPFALVVADDPEDGEYLQDALKVAGMRTFGCGNGADAVSLARDFVPDLIVIDYLLSDDSGEVVCRILRDDGVTEPIPIIVVTDDPRALPSDRSLADAVLARPCQPDLLSAAARLFVRHLSDTPD
jgi:CheY-like chemotaxis protein